MPSTIRDVALHAGVSTATVSRVLARIGTPRPETVAAVMAAVEQLGYRPSGVARSLKLQATRTLGLIVTDIQNPFFPELVRAVDDAATELGYTILLGSAADDDERAMAYLDLMVDRRVDGLIVASSQLTERHWAWLVDAPIPVVVVNAEPAGTRVPVIVSDNEAAGRAAVEHLAALGHERIGYIRGPDAYAATGPRLTGFRAGIAAAGLPQESARVAAADGREDGGRRAAAELLDADPGITAIACYNDMTAIGAMRALRAAGRRVPDDVSIVGCDDIAVAAWVDPPLTTVAQQKAAMGRMAVDWLLDALARGRATASTDVVRLPVSIRVRESTASPADRRETAAEPGAATASADDARRPATSMEVRP